MDEDLGPVEETETRRGLRRGLETWIDILNHTKARFASEWAPNRLRLLFHASLQLQTGTMFEHCMQHTMHLSRPLPYPLTTMRAAIAQGLPHLGLCSSK